MRLTEETLQSLHTLIAQNPALQAQLQQSDDVAQAARLLAQAARAAQIDITEDALRAHLESAIQEVTAQALTDNQLERVAGGMSKTNFIIVSIFSGGTFCATSSLMKAQKHMKGENVSGKECWDMV